MSEQQQQQQQHLDDARYEPRPRLYNQRPPQQARPSPALAAQWTCDRLTIGGGVAIFHVATRRVVLCQHSRRGHWFLPKGRRDGLEGSEAGAEREGYEESGYRNRILPLPLAHRQPAPALAVSKPEPEQQPSAVYAREPVWTMLMPLSTAVQYLLHWYVAETLPPGLEAEVSAAQAKAGTYQAPPPFPLDLTLAERLTQEPADYEPVRHEGTGVDAEEAQYTSALVDVDEAVARLGDTVPADVVRRGWAAIELRQRLERGEVVVRSRRGELSIEEVAGTA